MPLSSKGLWLAEMTMPASASPVAVSQATAGVGMTPSAVTSAPELHRPAVRAASSIPPEMRVSRPMNTRGLRPSSSPSSVPRAKPVR